MRLGCPADRCPGRRERRGGADEGEHVADAPRHGGGRRGLGVEGGGRGGVLGRHALGGADEVVDGPPGVAEPGGRPAPDDLGARGEGVVVVQGDGRLRVAGGEVERPREQELPGGREQPVGAVPAVGAQLRGARPRLARAPGARRAPPPSAPPGRAARRRRRRCPRSRAASCQARRMPVVRAARASCTRRVRGGSAARRTGRSSGWRRSGRPSCTRSRPASSPGCRSWAARPRSARTRSTSSSPAEPAAASTVHRGPRRLRQRLERGRPERPRGPARHVGGSPGRGDGRSRPGRADAPRGRRRAGPPRPAPAHR